jgi:DNA-directed RNA polymerase specialized sigma24 family protein
MRYRVPTKGKYVLPHDLYMSIIFMIRDYDRMKEEAQDMLDETSTPDGMPRGNSISDTVANKAAKRETLLAKIKAIEDSLNEVPPEYRKGIIDNIVEHKRYPDIADRWTFTQQKGRMICGIAERLNWK